MQSPPEHGFGSHGSAPCDPAAASHAAAAAAMTWPIASSFCSSVAQLERTIATLSAQSREHRVTAPSEQPDMSAPQHFASSSAIRASSAAWVPQLDCAAVPTHSAAATSSSRIMPAGCARAAARSAGR